MKILNGRKYLDANDYKRIAIMDVLGNYNVRVSGVDRDNINYQKSFIGDDIRSLKDEDAIEYILNYFLRYNKIVSVEDTYNTASDRKGIELTGESKRKLFLSVPDNLENRKKVISTIKDGFNLSLLETLSKEEIAHVELFINGIKKNKFELHDMYLYPDKKCMHININEKDKKTMEFFFKIMFERLKETDSYIELRLPKDKLYIAPNDYFYASDIGIGNDDIYFSINGFSNEIMEYIKEGTFLFNKQKEKINVRQLKMGGF